VLAFYDSVVNLWPSWWQCWMVCGQDFGANFCRACQWALFV